MTWLAGYLDRFEETETDMLFAEICFEQAANELQNLPPEREQERLDMELYVLADNGAFDPEREIIDPD